MNIYEQQLYQSNANTHSNNNNSNYLPSKQYHNKCQVTDSPN